MRLWLIALLLVVSCSEGSRELGTSDAPTGTLPAPTTELAAADVPWVEFEARWLCDLERSTYAEPGDVTEALDQRLADENIDLDGYARFQTRLDNETELARHVQAAVVARCGD